MMDTLQQWLFESLFQPVMLMLDMANLLEDGYLAAGWFLLGCCQVLIIVGVIVPLQRWRPVEAVTNPAAIRVDIFYTFIHRLGLFRLTMFFVFQPVLDDLFSWLRLSDWNVGAVHLDQMLPGLTDGPIASLLIYLIVFDFIDYWIHRAQHGYQSLWALHSLHHAQTQMTCWSDNRNHLLEDAMRDILVACAAFLIGVSPAQFVMIVVVTQLSESLQHANVQLSFGRVAERLWVGPAFHRRHHSVAHGFGHNFGVLLPWWDACFGTAQFECVQGQARPPCGPTGVGEPASDYGVGFLSQQWLGVRRLVRLWRPSAGA
jgi:sterol desaturase/sphingolipid hydroxylase (fatty acid hydroxylase superfamily)